MPNHIEQRLKITFPSKEDADTFLENYFSLDEDGEKWLDFNKIVPCPQAVKDAGNANVNTVDAAKKFVDYVRSKRGLDTTITPTLFKEIKEAAPEIKGKGIDASKFWLMAEAYLTTGYAYWYDWNRAYWGTKWNSYSNKIHPRPAPNVIVFDFETAWCTPSPILAQLETLYPEVDVEYLALDEGWNFGFYTQSFTGHGEGEDSAIFENNDLIRKLIKPYEAGEQACGKCNGCEENGHCDEVEMHLDKDDIKEYFIPVKGSRVLPAQPKQLN